MKSMPRNSIANKENNLLYSFSKNLKSKQDSSIKMPKERGNFIDRVNGYIETISSQKKLVHKDIKKSSVSNKTRKFSRPQDEVQTLSNRIKEERQINRNLQKCIIEIQQMLWDRSERLEILEQELKNNEKLHLRDSHTDHHHSSQQSCRRIRQDHRSTKQLLDATGLNRLLSKFVEEVNSESSNNHQESGSSISIQNAVLKKQKRIRTESETEFPSSKRRK